MTKKSYTLELLGIFGRGGDHLSGELSVSLFHR